MFNQVYFSCSYPTTTLTRDITLHYITNVNGRSPTINIPRGRVALKVSRQNNQVKRNTDLAAVEI